MIDGVEQIEYIELCRFLEQYGIEVILVLFKLEGFDIQGFNYLVLGECFWVERVIFDVWLGDFDVLVLFGGVVNFDFLCLSLEVIVFICEFVCENKFIVVICYGLWILIDVDLVQDKWMISWFSLKIDLSNVGVIWIDVFVVVDGKLVISCKLDDILVFNVVLLQELSEVMIDFDSDLCISGYVGL